jgi:hypothetical protein
MPFATCVLEIPDQFLLRINRYYGLLAFLRRPDMLVHMLAVRIAIAMHTAFLRFPIGLQALVEILKQPGNGVVTDVMP